MFADKTVSTGRLHAVVVIERTDRAPDLLVLVGDANHTGSYHLATQPASADAAPGQGRNRGDLQPALLCAVTGGDNSLGRVQTALAGQAQAPAEGQASANRCRRAPHRQASLRPLASCRRLNKYEP